MHHYDWEVRRMIILLQENGCKDTELLLQLGRAVNRAVVRILYPHDCIKDLLETNTLEELINAPPDALPPTEQT